MSHLTYIQRLYTYNDLANRRTFASLQLDTEPSLLTVKRMAHILAAEHTWYARLNGNVSALPVWPDLSFEEISEHLDLLKDNWTSYLELLGEAELTKTVEYKNSRGMSFKSRRDDILQHVIMHGAYHRGQIAGDVRTAGESPAVTDFIFFARDGLI